MQSLARRGFICQAEGQTGTSEVLPWLTPLGARVAAALFPTIDAGYSESVFSLERDDESLMVVDRRTGRIELRTQDLAHGAYVVTKANQRADPKAAPMRLLLGLKLGVPRLLEIVAEAGLEQTATGYRYAYSQDRYGTN